MAHPQEKPKKGWLQFLQFVMVSLGAGVIEYATFALMTWIVPGNQTMLVAAEITSVVLSCLFNFTVNRKYTFHSASNIPLGMLLYGVYYALLATPAGVWFLLFLTQIGLHELLAKAVKMLANFVFDYLFCKFILFQAADKVLDRIRRRLGRAGKDKAGEQKQG